MACKGQNKTVAKLLRRSKATHPCSCRSERFTITYFMTVPSVGARPSLKRERESNWESHFKGL